MEKKCVICNKIFDVKGRDITCSKLCSKQNKKILNHNIYKRNLYRTRARRNEASRKFRKENKEYFIKYKQLHRRENAMHEQNRRAKLKEVKHSFTKDEYLNKVYNTGGICPVCNTYVGYDKLELDHLIPLSKSTKGFIYTKDHIIPMCKKCNCSKGNKVLDFLDYKNLVLKTISLNKDKKGD